MIEESPELKDYIIKRLSTIDECEADPQVLADYIIALLKHDKPQNELKTFCINELNDFLGKATSDFISHLFTAINSKSYLSKSQPPRPAAPPKSPQRKPVQQSAQQTQQPASNLVSQQSENRRRQRESDDIEDERSSKRHQQEPTQAQPAPSNGADIAVTHNIPTLSSGPSDRSDGIFGASESNGRRQGQQRRPGHRDFENGGRRDLRDSLPRNDRFNGRPMPGHPYGGMPKKKGRCRDFDEKGYCRRGDSCMYIHANPIIVEDMQRPPYMMPPGMMRPPGPPLPHNFMRPPMGHRPMMQRPPMMGGQETIIGLTPNPEGGRFMPPPGPPSMGRGGPIMGGPPGVGAGRPPQHFYGRGRGAVRPHNQPVSKSLVVEKIPAEKCNIPSVNDFFQKFGNIVNIKLNPQYQQAIVAFGTVEEAAAAYDCPDVIFGNRFVKVYYHNPDKHGASPVPRHIPSSSHVSPPTRPPFETTHQGPSTISQITPEQRQQQIEEEVAAKIEAKKRKDEQISKLLDIQKQKRELVEKHLESQKSLMAKLESTKDAAEKKLIMTRLKAIDATVKDLTAGMKAATAAVASVGAPKSTIAKQAAEEKEKERLDRELDMISQINTSGGSDALKETMEKLRSEAAALGIDPNQVTASTRGGRGGYSSYRGGRGGGRGGYKGKYNVDNRTTKIMIKSLTAENKSTVETHFKTFGEIESVTPVDDSSVIVQFKTRAEAEKAVMGASSIAELSGIKLFWHNAPTPSQSEQVAPTESGSAPTSQDGTTVDASVGRVGYKSEDDEEEDEEEKGWRR